MRLWIGTVIENNHLTRFGGHEHCGSGDVMFLIFHMISQDHVPQEPWDFLGRSPKVSHHHASIEGHRHCGSGDVMALVFQMISEDNVFKGSCNVMASCPST